MKLREGARVLTSDGERLGDIDRLVIDPKTKEVTHLVVRKGFLFSEDKVVPLSLVGSAKEDQVILREDAQDLEALPEFEQTHYVPVDEAETGMKREPGYARWLYLYPGVGWPYSHMGPSAFYPSLPPYVAVTERSIPEGSVALKEGARVISRDGHHVGDVEAVLTDSQEDRATHLVVSAGVLFKETKLVPTAWVSTVLEDEVHLTVGSGLLEQLPEYEA